MIPKDEYRSTDAARHIGQQTEQDIRRAEILTVTPCIFPCLNQAPDMRALITDAAEAAERINADELEAHAARVNAYRPKE